MRKLYLILFTFFTYISFGQNTFPTNGSVGIGTTNPQALLDINGNVIISRDPSNLGIGTSNGYLRLYMDGASGNSGIGSNLYYDGTSWKYANVAGYGGKGMAIDMYSSVGIRFFASSNAINPALLTNVFQIGVDGRIGIGTTNPISKLNIHKGDILISTENGIADAGTYSIGITNASNVLGIGWAFSKSYNWGGSAKLITGRPAGGFAGQAGLLVQTFDDVGGYPKQNTHVTINSIKTIPDSRAVVFIDEGGEFVNNASLNGSSNQTPSLWTTKSTFLATNAGNVGIGTTVPTQKIEIAGTAYINSENSGFVVDAANHSRVGLMKYYGIEAALVHGNQTPLRFGQVNQVSVLGGTFTEQMRIDNNGNVGIGTTNPGYKLQVEGKARFQDAIYVKNGSLIGYVGPKSDWMGSSTTNNDLAIGSYNQNLAFFTNNDVVERMRITASGQVVIGSVLTIPTDYKLAVAGNVIAEKVKVKKSNTWPDFVFSPNYKLLNLGEVESFIKQNSHLPEIPSATEIEKDGQDLGEMNRLLLKKVEELTLYLIEEKKRNDNLQNRVEILEKIQIKKPIKNR